ncbi:MAG TPA: TraB/GumN family protein [Rhizomicrobium sp.]|jgi:uncharacterized protein YbaP (TraB family)
MKRLALAVVLACVPFAGAAENAPAPAAAPTQDWSQTIETVVVTAERHGPLLWHIKKGDSELIILGIVDPVPKKLDWDTGGVEAALKGAKQLILPPGASVGLVEGLWFLMWNHDVIYLPDSTPMESTLPDALRQRFTTARDRLHRDADRYSSLRVPLAGLRLVGDFQTDHGLTAREPSDTVEKLARHAGVSSKRAAEYEALPLIKQLPKMSAAANEACMKDALDDLEIQSAHADAAAQAWASGDLAGIKANSSDDRFESCIQALPNVAALFQRSVNDSLSAANAALARPGKTVMVVSMGPLLRKGGILDRLAAEGLTIEAPSNSAS